MSVDQDIAFMGDTSTVISVNVKYKVQALREITLPNFWRIMTDFQLTQCKLSPLEKSKEISINTM